MGEGGGTPVHHTLEPRGCLGSVNSLTRPSAPLRMLVRTSLQIKYAAVPAMCAPNLAGPPP